MKFNMIIGGIIAYILMALYGGIAVYIIIRVIGCSKDPSCTTLDFHEGVVYVLTTVGALVSALVISKLAITQPGKDPSVMDQLGDEQPKFVKFIVWSYLVLWTVIGLAALVTGVLLFPGVNKTLSDFGSTWLGTAVAAGYAYFNIDPKG